MRRAADVLKTPLCAFPMWSRARPLLAGLPSEGIGIRMRLVAAPGPTAFHYALCAPRSALQSDERPSLRSQACAPSPARPAGVVSRRIESRITPVPPTRPGTYSPPRAAISISRLGTTDSLLYRSGWSSACLRGARRRAAACQGCQLANPSGVRLEQPDLAPLARGAGERPSDDP